MDNNPLKSKRIGYCKITFSNMICVQIKIFLKFASLIVLDMIFSMSQTFVENYEPEYERYRYPFTMRILFPHFNRLRHTRLRLVSSPPPPFRNLHHHVQTVKELFQINKVFPDLKVRPSVCSGVSEGTRHFVWHGTDSAVLIAPMLIYPTHHYKC